MEVGRRSRGLFLVAVWQTQRGIVWQAVFVMSRGRHPLAMTCGALGSPILARLRATIPRSTRPSFLLTFLEHCKTVQATEEDAKKLKEQPEAGKGKELQEIRKQQLAGPAKLKVFSVAELSNIRNECEASLRQNTTKTTEEIEALLAKYAKMLPQLREALLDKY